MFNRFSKFKRITKGETLMTKVQKEAGDRIIFKRVPLSSVKEELPPPEVFSVSSSLASGKNLQQVSSLLPSSNNPADNVISEEALLHQLEAQEKTGKL